MSQDPLSRIVGRLDAMLSAYFEAVESQSRTKLHLFVNCIQAVFEPLSTTGQCAASIKLLMLGDASSVRTVVRDDVSATIRGRIDSAPTLQKYPLYGNRAFFNILTREDAKDYFICNDLVGLGEYYFNLNPAWRSYYNATIVFPIKWPHASADEDDDLMGFVCVDSKDGKFDEGVSLPLLSMISKLLYYHLWLYRKS